MVGRRVAPKPWLAAEPREEPLSDEEARLLAYGRPNVMFPRLGKGARVEEMKA